MAQAEIGDLALASVGNLTATAVLEAADNSGDSVRVPLDMLKDALDALAPDPVVFPGDVAVTGNLTAATVIAEDSIALGGAPGAPGTVTSGVKAITGFSNGVAKAVLDVSVPNTNAAIGLRLTSVESMGAGGSGAYESTRTTWHVVAIARRSGVAAVVGFNSNQTASANTSNALAATSIGATAVSGGAGDVNTFSITMTVTRNSGAGDNHTMLLFYEIIAAAGTVTIT